MPFLDGYGDGVRSLVRLLPPPTLAVGFLFISTMCSSAKMSISADSANFPPAYIQETISVRVSEKLETFCHAVSINYINANFINTMLTRGS